MACSSPMPILFSDKVNIRHEVKARQHSRVRAGHAVKNAKADTRLSWTLREKADCKFQRSLGIEAVVRDFMTQIGFAKAASIGDPKPVAGEKRFNLLAMIRPAVNEIELEKPSAEGLSSRSSSMQ